MRRVLDASVIVKWLLRDPGSEPHTAEALALMEAVAAGEVEVLKPPHWLAEVAAVMPRLRGCEEIVASGPSSGRGAQAYRVVR